MDLTVFQVDAFTTMPFQGNPAGVVLNADGLSEHHMQQIARELNNSETAFIFNRPTDEYEIEVRFFTPTKEVPICGHATIASHYVYAKEHGIDQGIIRQKTKAGILPVEIVQEDHDLRIIMTQAAIKFGKTLDEAEIDLLVRGLRLRHDDLDRSLPIQIVSTGHSKVMVPIKSKAVLDAIRINETHLCELSALIACNGFYTFSFDTQERDVLVCGRIFAPAIGIAEDPVTGNANGPLGAYLTRCHRIKQQHDGFTFTIAQGEAMRRKGYMNVHVYSSEKEAELIKISGRACIVFKTTISM
ncbi:predicted epimerase [Candidatus Moduliflexus flocculans]|uniref:Predicted epimerase n=1 Tax=Candidatus Moduliflexus flocculans TaxID=1499966 RepID=A0A0S6W4V3_9BACT|nr:predicted epimerase [Candidatus Moduliflexus flocculans]